MKRAEVVAKVVAAYRSAVANGTRTTPTLTEAAKERMRQRMRDANPMRDPAVKERSLSKTRAALSPSGLERWFSEACEAAGLPIRFTGCGGYWLSGRNPDYKVNGRKLLIELTDGYCRRPQRRTAESYAEPTIQHYRKYGHECLVVMVPPGKRENALLTAAVIAGVKLFLETGQSFVWTWRGLSSIGSQPSAA